MKRLRTELGDVPFVCGELGRFKDAYAPMNEVLRAVPTFIDRAACVSSEGLKDKGDATHFDAAGARELGRRYAAAMLRLKP